MIRYLSIIAIVLLAIAKFSFSNIPLQQNPKIINCQYHGHQLYGRVQFVEANPDVRVRIVREFPDYRVKVVPNTSPKSCGQWHIVNAFPDLRVQIVNGGADFTIEFVP